MHATGEERYANWYATFARYVDEHVIDHEGGSWFHQLNGDNRVIGTVWPGKSDLYHAFQSTLIRFLDRLCPLRRPCEERGMGDTVRDNEQARSDGKLPSDLAYSRLMRSIRSTNRM